MRYTRDQIQESGELFSRFKSFLVPNVDQRKAGWSLIEMGRGRGGGGGRTNGVADAEGPGGRPGGVVDVPDDGPSGGVPDLVHRRRRRRRHPQQGHRQEEEQGWGERPNYAPPLPWHRTAAGGNRDRHCGSEKRRSEWRKRGGDAGEKEREKLPLAAFTPTVLGFKTRPDFL